MQNKSLTKIPVFVTGNTLKSLRDSGYSFAAALGEVIDNSLEANANAIKIRMEEGINKRGKNHIQRVVITDDGDGMSPDILHHYPQVGFSTRYMSKTTIGKYGVGAKLAAMNWCRRIDVWSRHKIEYPWLHVYLDLDEIDNIDDQESEIGIDAPTEHPILKDISDSIPKGTGTIVVWSKIDRLEEGKLAPDSNSLRIDVEKELSRMFRYFLDGGINIFINETKLLPHDPLFLMEGTWADKMLQKEYSRLGKKEKQKDHYPARIIGRETIKVDHGKAELIVTLYPPEVVRQRQRGGDDLAKSLRIPENEGAISFVRLNREINYTNVPRIFPRGVEAPDRFIGIQVSFSPELDEYFGVRNVKRGVEPHDELRKDIRKYLEKYVKEARARLDDIWGKVSLETRQHEGEHTEVMKAAVAVNQVLPKGRAKGPETEEEREKIFEDLAKDVGKSNEKEIQEYIGRIKDLPFVVESVDFPGTNFVDIQHIDGKVIIRLNTRHRFYRELWEPVRTIANLSAGDISGDQAIKSARKTIEALSVLIIAYGKAESMHTDPRDQYGDLRSYWGQFLDSMMGKVKGVL